MAMPGMNTMNRTTSVATVALLASSTAAGSTLAATAYDLRHGAQFLKERFQAEYFADATTEAERAVAVNKTLIHVLAQALAVNDACGFGLDLGQVEDVARRLGLGGPIGRDFFADVHEQIAEVTGDEAEADPASTCSNVRTLYEAAAPLVNLELGRSARSSETPDAAAAAVSEPEQATGLSDLIVTAMLSGSCERLVVAGDTFSDYCNGGIIQSVYSTGRAGFTLAIGDKGGAVTFSGIEGTKPNADSQLQSLDKVVFTIGIEEVPPNVTAVTGSCVYGNPYKGPVTISCQGTDADNRPYLLQFRTDGSPPSITDFRKKEEAAATPDDTFQEAAPEPATAEATSASSISAGEAFTTAPISTSTGHLDTATVPIAFSDGTATVPLKIDPAISETRPIIDLERMITDEAFARQSFPDFVCPPTMSALTCSTTIEAAAKILKSYVADGYQPTERWCREVEWNARVKGTADYASGLKMQMLQATLIANNVRSGAEERSFNPYGYYFYRALMAAEVCLGLRQ